MPPKKKVKRKKSGKGSRGVPVKQKQKQTQIVTVNVAAAPRRRRRTKKPASGAGAGAGAPPPPQGFAQVIYPVVNPLQRDTQFNLAGIQAQLKTLQDRALGGVPLGAMPTQTQVQLGGETSQPTSLGEVASSLGETPIGDPEDVFFDTEPFMDDTISMLTDLQDEDELTRILEPEPKPRRGRGIGKKTVERQAAAAQALIAESLPDIPENISVSEATIATQDTLPDQPAGRTKKLRLIDDEDMRSGSLESTLPPEAFKMPGTTF